MAANAAHALVHVPSPRHLTRPAPPPAPRWSEALDFPAELLAELPLPPRLTLHVPGIVGLVVIALDAPGADGEVALDRDEWLALVHGVCADRVWPHDFVAWCRRKQAEPGFRIDDETTLAGAERDHDERWTARRVLDRVGAALLSVDLAA